MSKMFSRCATFLAALVAITTGTLASAQGYPNKPVKLLVGFPAGGGLDVLARIIGQRVSGQWGQLIIIENKPGAGSNIAGDAAASRWSS